MAKLQRFFAFSDNCKFVDAAAMSRNQWETSALHAANRVKSNYVDDSNTDMSVYYICYSWLLCLSGSLSGLESVYSSKRVLISYLTLRVSVIATRQLWFAGWEWSVLKSQETGLANWSWQSYMEKTVKMELSNLMSLWFEQYIYILYKYGGWRKCLYGWMSKSLSLVEAGTSSLSL